MLRIGQKVEGEVYKKRPSAYVIIERDEDELVAIATDDEGTYFLLGGGIEAGESELDAIKREVIEESGYSIYNIRLFDKLTSWSHSDRIGYLDVAATIYLAKFKEKVAEPVEIDHKVMWVSPADYVGKLYHEFQNYALEKYIEKKNNK